MPEPALSEPVEHGDALLERGLVDRPLAAVVALGEVDAVVEQESQDPDVALWSLCDVMGKYP